MLDGNFGKRLSNNNHSVLVRRNGERRERRRKRGRHWTDFEKEYKGLESVVGALRDLAARKVWGKAVIHIKDDEKAKL